MTRSLLSELSKRVRLLLTGLGAFLAMVLLLLLWPLGPLLQQPTSTVLYDRHGELLGATVARDGQWRFSVGDSVPERFTTCLIQFEDRHFKEHHGVHFPSLVRALKQNMAGKRRVSGGSTLTMQVARLSYQGAPRTYFQKIKEIVLAWRLEAHLSKRRILDLFCANAPFGGNVVGLEAAAWRYYGRPAHRLSWSECATLAVLPNAPSAIYPGKGHEQLRAKRDRLLHGLHAIGAIDDLEWSLARAEDLPGRSVPVPQRAPHLLATLRTTGFEGRTFHSTLDGGLQDRATRIVATYFQTLSANEVHNAAVVVQDLATAQVLAYVGNMPGSGPDHAGAVDIVRARRSTGSLLKPFLYAHMLQTGELLPDMLVADVPTRFQGLDPRNFDERFRGALPASEALARSLNVPAVRMLRAHGTGVTIQAVRAMGVKGIDRPPSHYGLSLIVGGAESDLLSLTNAYGNLGRILIRSGSQAAGPVIVEPVFRNGQPAVACSPDRSPISPAAAYFTLKALREVQRPESQGGWSHFANARRISWKTGTSMGHRDAWAIGLDGNSVVGVWTGNASGEGRPGLTGTLAAAPILFDLMGQLPEGAPFEVPFDDLVYMPLCRRSGHPASDACPEVDTVRVPDIATRPEPCPYHRTIRVDPGRNMRVPAGEPGELASWFVLPPVMEHFYSRYDPTYQPLPPWSEDQLAVNAELPMEMIYPERGARILLPTDLTGQQCRAVLEAAHREPDARVYWHLDGELIGTTEKDHRLPMATGSGEHVLVLTDQNGRSLEVRFTVIGDARTGG